MKIRIGKRLIGEGEPCFIIAEAGVNHNGEIELAKKLIDVAKEAGADAVKFQTFKTENIVTKDADMAEYQKKNLRTIESQPDMLKKYELKEGDFLELKKYCDEKGIIFLSTPHTEDAIDFLEKLVPAFKIGSGDLNNLPFLEKIAKKGKPIILSTGMGTLEEVTDAVKAIKKKDQLILLHCTTDYPCAEKDVNLKAMQTIKDKLHCLVGYSDHTLSLKVPVIAASLGAVVVEKHITLKKTDEGPDHKASLNPDEFKEMVKDIKENKKINITEEILGTGIKKPTKKEEEIKKVVRKSIIAKTNIPKGTIITKNMLVIKRPGTGIEPKDINKVIGKRIKKDIEKDNIIKWDNIAEG